MDLSTGLAALDRIAAGGGVPIGTQANVRAALDAHPVTARRHASPDAALGTWDTPWPVADALAGAVASAPGDFAAWGDPCCGVGRLLVATWQAFAVSRPPSAWPGLLDRLVAGDVDRDAVEVARGALAMAVAVALGGVDDAGAIARGARRALDVGVRVRDAFDTLAAMERPARVVTNPPFVSTRRMHRTLGADAVRRLRAAHPECRGAFDLGVPIVARALDAVSGVGGALALVAPAAWQTADYAAPLRERLDARSWASVYPARRPFGAAVDVVVAASPAGHDGSTLRWTSSSSAPGCVPLSDLADVWAGTPGFEARAIADALFEAWPQGEAGLGARTAGAMRDVARSNVARSDAAWPDAAWSDAARFDDGPSDDGPSGDGPSGGRPSDLDGDSWPFVTSGVVGAWTLRDRPVRFLGATWRAPRLFRGAVRSPARRARYDRPAWLLPGVAASLRAAWSPRPTALGVGVLAVAAPAPWTRYIGAVLNADATTRVWRAAHPGAALSNGYVRLSVGLLSSTPVPDPARPDVRAALPRIDALVDRAIAGDAQAGQAAMALVDALR